MRLHRLHAALLLSSASVLAAEPTVEDLVSRGRFSDALPRLQAARDAAESAGRRDAEVATVLNNLGSVYYELGRHRDAVGALSRSLALRRDLGEVRTHEVARTLNNLGAAYMKLNLLSKAEETLARAAAMDEGLSGAKIWVNLGLVYQAEHRWPDAEALFRKTLEVRERELGPAHRDVGATLNSLGVLLQDQKRFHEAEPLLHRAVYIWEIALGSDHPLVAAGSHNLGVLSASLGRTDEAEKYFQRAIQIATLSLPPDHPNLTSYMSSYALLLRKLHRNNQAKELETSVKQSRERYNRNNLLGYTVDALQLKQ